MKAAPLSKKQEKSLCLLIVRSMVVIHLQVLLCRLSVQAERQVTDTMRFSDIFSDIQLQAIHMSVAQRINIIIMAYIIITIYLQV